MPPLLRQLYTPAKSSPPIRHSFLLWRRRFTDSRVLSNDVRSPSATTSYHPVYDGLVLEITTPANATPETPTILCLPFYTPEPTAPKNSITITPIHVSETIPIFPAILHDITLSLSEVRRLFPRSATGILASRYAGGLALSTALTQGRSTVAAVAVDEPVVDLLAEGQVEWDLRAQRWIEQPGSEERSKYFGSDPTKYWTDPFASPLNFFVEPSWTFPPPHLRSEKRDDTLELEPVNPRRRRVWPPMGFVPGVGWGLQPKGECIPRMLLTLGTGEQARSRALFVDSARRAIAPPDAWIDPDTLRVMRPARGVNHGETDVGVLKMELGPDAMGELLEGMLRGQDVSEALEKSLAGSVLWKRGQGKLDVVVGGEKDVAPGDAAATRSFQRAEELPPLSRAVDPATPAAAVEIAQSAIKEGRELPDDSPKREQKKSVPYFQQAAPLVKKSAPPPKAKSYPKKTEFYLKKATPWATKPVTAKKAPHLPEVAKKAEFYPKKTTPWATKPVTAKRAPHLPGVAKKATPLFMKPATPKRAPHLLEVAKKAPTSIKQTTPNVKKAVPDAVKAAPLAQRQRASPWATMDVRAMGRHTRNKL